MKKSICIWILLICNVTWVEAQMVSVVQRITVEKKVPAFYPVFNSDGSELLYTSENYKGLYLYKLNNKTSLMITDAEGAGYSPDFSQNNDKIYYRSVERENMHRQNTLMCYDRQLLQSKNCMNSPVRLQSELNKVRMGLEYMG